MEKQEIFERLKELLLCQYPEKKELIEKGTLDGTIDGYYELTSVGMLYLIIVIENEFDFEFTDVGMKDFETLGQVVDYIYEIKR